MRIRGNAFLYNEAYNGAGALLVGTSGFDSFISNNSFLSNTAGAGTVSGYFASGAGTHWVSNNVFKSNSVDLRVTPSTALIRNVYGSISGAPSLSQLNIVGSPGFSSPYYFDLASTSVARNSGTNLPFGGGLSVDIKGRTRPQEGTIDRGALEYPHLFGNGFE